MDCKFCGSTRTTKYGRKVGTQYYRCNNCRRKFADRMAPEGMRFSTSVIGQALALYYDGLSFTNIVRHLMATDGTHVNPTTIWHWVISYSKKSVRVLNQFRAKTSPCWLIVETPVTITGEKAWLWDVMDSQTRFLFASYLTFTRGLHSAIACLKEGEMRAVGIPKEIISARLAPYPEAVEEVFGADSTHITATESTSLVDANLIKAFQAKAKYRTNVLQRLKKVDIAKIVCNGFVVHYNFIFPHTSLKGSTPAVAAGLNLPFRTWAGLVAYLDKTEVFSFANIKVL